MTLSTSKGLAELDWDRAWTEAVEANERISQNIEKWTDFWSRYAEQYSIEVEAERALHQKVIDYLDSEGRLCRKDRVIDIGCGPGTYALLMCHRVRWITCLDSSEGMLEKLRADATKMAIGNINLMLGGWEDAHFNVQYDLAICARSPAIKSRSGLLKMEEVSRRDCCFIAGASEEEEKEWNELWDLIVDSSHPSPMEKAINYNLTNPLNILLEEGRDPDLKHFYEIVEVTLDADMVIANTKKNFQIYTRLTKAKEKIIEDRINSWCNNGRYHVKRKMGVAVLTWKVPEVRAAKQL